MVADEEAKVEETSKKSLEDAERIERSVITSAVHPWVFDAMSARESGGSRGKFDICRPKGVTFPF